MIVPSLYRSPLALRSFRMTRPTRGLSLSAPWHLVQSFGLPWALFGSVSPVILPKSLPPWSYSSTCDTTLPLFSSTVFHLPTGESAASTGATPTSALTSTAITSRLIVRSLVKRDVQPVRRRVTAEHSIVAGGAPHPPERFLSSWTKSLSNR